MAASSVLLPHPVLGSTTAVELHMSWSPLLNEVPCRQAAYSTSTDYGHQSHIRHVQMSKHLLNKEPAQPPGGAGDAGTERVPLNLGPWATGLAYLKGSLFLPRHIRCPGSPHLLSRPCTRRSLELLGDSLGCYSEQGIARAISSDPSYPFYNKGEPQGAQKNASQRSRKTVLGIGIGE